MPDQKQDARSASPSRQILLSADKEELVGVIETLQADLQRRMEVEEEILHLNLQRGTASLQSQVEEASRRFKVASRSSRPSGSKSSARRAIPPARPRARTSTRTSAPRLRRGPTATRSAASSRPSAAFATTATG
jgi:hypothetical protein